MTPNQFEQLLAAIIATSLLCGFLGRWSAELAMVVLLHVWRSLRRRRRAWHRLTWWGWSR